MSTNKKLRSALALPVLFCGLVASATVPGCSGEDNPLCCGEGDFKVGGTISQTGTAGVAMQAVADVAAIASASVDDLTAACRSIAEDLDADAAQRKAADQLTDKREKMNTYCELAVAAIGSFKATAGGTLSINFQPPVCEASISAKADCQAKCSGTAECDIKANPPTCERGDMGKAQCTVELAHDDFKTMLSDPNAGMQLYFQGKLRVSGDPMLAMKLQQLFEIARPK